MHTPNYSNPGPLYTQYHIYKYIYIYRYIDFKPKYKLKGDTHFLTLGVQRVLFIVTLAEHLGELRRMRIDLGVLCPL